MELITYRITLDTNRNGVQRTLQGFETGDALSRELRISLTDGKESYEIPLDNSVSAVMYVTTPSGVLCVNDCDIDGNEVVYKVLDTDTLESGIVQMQIKLIAEDKVLVSPRFALDVWESSVDDSEAIANPVFNALENALREAREAYNKSVASVIIDEDYLFVVRYKDGSEYTSSVIQDALKLLENIEQYIEDAKAAAITATIAKDQAESYAGIAEISSLNASDSATIAQASKSEALRAEVSAINSKEAAQRSESNAYIYAEQAAQAEGFSDKARVDAQRAESAKDVAVSSSAIAESNGNLAKSYTVGGTGTRPGEDEDNARWYYEHARAIAHVDIATTEIAGIVKIPTDGTITIDADGTIHSAAGGSTVSVSADLTSGTKVASIDVDGNTTDIYAPTPVDPTWGSVSGKPFTMVDGQTLKVESDVLKAVIPETPIATSTTVGLVKPDNDTITIDADGTISAPKQSYTASEIATSDGSNVEAKLGGLGDDVSALNENLTSLLTTIIASGDTSATITDSKINTDSIVDVYFKDKVLAPTKLEVTNGQIDIEIDAQETDTEVGIRVM